MRILLDNCVHEEVADFFKGHGVKTAVQTGLASLSNGELLAQASGQFDVLVTTDKNIRYQQNLSKLPIAVLELNSKDTRIEALRLLAPYLADALERTHDHRFVAVYEGGKIESLAARTI